MIYALANFDYDYWKHIGDNWGSPPFAWETCICSSMSTWCSDEKDHRCSYVTWCWTRSRQVIFFNWISNSLIHVNYYVLCNLKIQSFYYVFYMFFFLEVLCFFKFELYLQRNFFQYHDEFIFNNSATSKYLLAWCIISYYAFEMLFSLYLFLHFLPGISSYSWNLWPRWFQRLSMTTPWTLILVVPATDWKVFLKIFCHPKIPIIKSVVSTCIMAIFAKTIITCVWWMFMMFFIGWCHHHPNQIRVLVGIVSHKLSICQALVTCTLI